MLSRHKMSLLAVLTVLMPGTAVPCRAQTTPSSADAVTLDPAAILSRLDRLISVPREARPAAAVQVVADVAARFDALPPDELDRLAWRMWAAMRGTGLADADRAPVLRAMTDAARAADTRGDNVAALFFHGWMVAGVPPEQRLGQAREAHRRAAAEGALEAGPARRARLAIVDETRALNESGASDEAYRALGDTVSELDAAGLRTLDTDMLRGLAESAALTGNGAQSDMLFAALIAQSAAAASSPRRDRDLQLLNNQWSYYLNLQRRFADAEAPGLIAATMAETQLGRPDIRTQKARYNYALALLGQGKAQSAAPFFEEALPLQLAEEKLWSQGEADTVILLTTLARARAQLPGRGGDALDAAADAADRVRRRQAARLDSGTAPGGDPAVAALSRAMGTGTRRDPLAAAYDMVLFAGWAARAERKDALGSAFVAAQDLTLSDAGSAINAAAARDVAGDGALGELVRQRQDGAARIKALAASYRDAALGTDRAAAEAVRARLAAEAAALAALDAALARDFPAYDTLVSPSAVAVGDAQKALSVDEALLMLVPSEADLYVFALSAKKTHWHRIDGGAASVATLSARLTCRVDEATCSAADYNDVVAAEGIGGVQPIDDRYPRYDRAAAYQLYQSLIAPARSALPDGARVYVVAGGPVAGFPLAALVASAPTGDPQAGDAATLQATDWLGDHYRFVTLPSVAALALAPRRSGGATGDRLVAYGDPLLLGSGTAAGARGAGGTRQRGGVSVRSGGLAAIKAGKTSGMVDRLRALDPLPGTRVELTRIAAVLAAGKGLRLGADATEHAVKADTALATADTVVFATHGLLPGEMGAGSEPGLVLTPPPVASDDDDGLLTAGEAAQLSLSAHFVVLSACNTANPGTSLTPWNGGGGESLSALARSFLYAGAGNLLATHWRVADDATAALTVEILGNRAATPARALGDAMAAIRTGTRADGSAVEGWAPHWAHPASWAPFALITNRDR
ncbi:MAG: hypothetical protein RLZZ58_1630 [Pseudomonadota bacterium]